MTKRWCCAWACSTGNPFETRFQLPSQSARIVAVVTPASDADEVAALCTECTLKMLVSIPALLSTVF